METLENNKDILFSIIVPIYNVNEFLPECVSSIINQSYRNIEVILVDDGSTDGCGKLCDDYKRKDSRIVVIHKENGGLVSARQAGVSIAKGSYVICVDGDDWIETDYCQEMAQILSEQTIDIICCGYYKCFPDRKEKVNRINFESGYYTKQQIEKRILPHLFEDKYGFSFGLSMWAKTVKKDLMLTYQMKVPQEISIGEDSVCMGPCIFHAYSLYITEKCLYNYRQNPESMTGNGKVFSWNGPELRGRHLEKVIDLSLWDMQNQLYRGVVHALFNVTKSQFNRVDCTKSEIRKDIIRQLNREYYSEAINNARFFGIRANAMKYFLKFRCLRTIDYINSRKKK